MNRPSFPCTSGLLALGLILGACAEGDGGQQTFFVPQNTSTAVVAGAEVAVLERLLVYQASEAALGQDLNDDSVTDDQVVVVLDMATLEETVLGVQGSDFVIDSDQRQIFFVCDEAQDGRDWDGDGTADELVLLHSPPTGSNETFGTECEFIASLTRDPASVRHLARVDGRIYFCRDASQLTLSNGETTLAFVDPSASETTVNAVGAVDTANTHEPRILGADDGLLFLWQDEVVEGRTISSDLDPNDPFVLALLDATDPSAQLKTVGRSIVGASAAFDAFQLSSSDWTVAFLVDELTQNDFTDGMNDASLFGGSWEPEACSAYADTDQNDQVLTLVNFSEWLAGQAAQVINTGLPGTTRAIAGSDWVATVARESDESTDNGGCDLNDDGDTADQIVRWTLIATPIAPFGTIAELSAIPSGAGAIPGGAGGVTQLDDRLVCVVSESRDERDHDNDSAQTHDLLAWLDPSDGANADWTFDMNPVVGQSFFFNISWLTDVPTHDHLRLAFKENVTSSGSNGLDLNDDGDESDSLGAFAAFDPDDAEDLDFSWPPTAVAANNAGYELFGGVAFLRVSEAADGRDWNGDGDSTDMVLARALITGQSLAIVATLNDIADSPSVFGGDTVGVAWIADEAAADQDYNDDNDTNDLVVRWMRIGF